MASNASSVQRVRVDGKFLRLGANKFFVKGITYGPFVPDDTGHYFPSPAQAERDLAQIRELGANVIRVYSKPPKWLLDLALAGGIRVMVDVPWNKHICVLDSKEMRQEVVNQVRDMALHCARHPATLAISVVNEIPPDIVRWTGPRNVSALIEHLVTLVKEVDPECLCTFGNFPPTEYLNPENIDFLCYNVYLHNQRAFDNYLARLQMIADTKPLILGEFGIDTVREGEEAQAEILSWQVETLFRGGLAGGIVFSFTDDWFKDHILITDWAFGVTTAERKPKAGFRALREKFNAAPYFTLPRYPMVSVVVASYNGARTLEVCLESLQRINYPNVEVILVDDGSTDQTTQIAEKFPKVRYIRHDVNRGLSAARNTGIQAARGQIVAFTDSDCRADEDWLHYTVSALLTGQYAAVGGHNFLPPEDSWVAAAVMLSPGGPAHVMLTDRVAEHIPGCNMVFYKWALEEINGFDPLFRKAGDDVDVCWRLQQRGYKIGFSPSGFVWHYRRSTVADYLKQQSGYGEAEALLVHRHPEYFNWFGGSQWQGKIYSPSKFGVLTRRPLIYHGWFGAGFFQTLYTPAPSFGLMLLTSLEYHAVVVTPLIVLAVVFRQLIPVAVASMLIPLAVCAVAAWQADLAKDRRRPWSRPLVALLFFLQPIFRGAARYKGSVRTPRRATMPAPKPGATQSAQDGGPEAPVGQLIEYWNERGIDRVTFLNGVIEDLDQHGWPNKVDTGWNNYDLEILGTTWARLHLTTVAEAIGHGKEMIRCRLKPRWTFVAKLVMSAVIGVDLLLIGLLMNRYWWVVFVLLSVPLMMWFMAEQQRKILRQVAVFLDDVGQKLKLRKIEAKPLDL
ncbi:MAG TPA: glycosyltransferase [Methylomirabilota bacterium]|nr:glycosyltransferase [Methylomirabilota bacterium]